jgi:hypothetical protein
MMQRKHRNPDNYNLALLDMLFAMCLAYAILFMISLLMIKPISKPSEANMKMPAQFIVTLDWPGGSLDDIDLWLQIPSGDKVYYQRSSAGFVLLDRDDIGGEHDIKSTDGPGSPVTWLKLNREMITIRAIEPGRYVVAVHAFSAKQLINGQTTERPLPFDVTVEVMKLNPTASVIAKATARLEKMNDRVTVLAFTVNDKGDVTSVEQTPADEVVTLRALSEHGP